ncbi:hypothetical protein [Roseateles sp. P5_E1]
MARNCRSHQGVSPISARRWSMKSLVLVAWLQPGRRTAWMRQAGKGWQWLPLDYSSQVR